VIGRPSSSKIGFPSPSVTTAYCVLVCDVEPDADVQAVESTSTFTPDVESSTVPVLVSVLEDTFFVVLHPTSKSRIIKNKKPLMPFATLFEIGISTYHRAEILATNVKIFPKLFANSVESYHFCAANAKICE
jgi:hypothetical protein